MRARLALALPAAALAVAAGCGGSARRPFTIGVLANCSGPVSYDHEAVEAAAELPFVVRGARPPVSPPSAAGVLHTDVAGRHVELRFGCVAGTEDVIPEARRLVEEDGAGAVVGAVDPMEGMVLRAYARRQPGVVFVVQPSAAPELTLADPAPNVFRFAPDGAQSVAGLAAYAYRTLGWRTAATVADDNPYGWSQSAGFVAEFCALGGRVLEQETVSPDADPSAVAARLPHAADGVYLQTIFVPTAPILRSPVVRRPGTERVVASSPLLADAATAREARGAIVASAFPLAGSAALRSYLAAFSGAFPAIAGAALDPVAASYRDGVEAVLEALPTGDGADGLRGSLARLALSSPRGLLRLDRNRQALAADYLGRVDVTHGAPRLVPVATVRGVAQGRGDASSRRTPCAASAAH
jgi:branched-chain amino acid transport system substrate-binding protein